MKTIVRTTECPPWTKAQILKFHPGYTVLGSSYGWFAPVHETKVVFVDYGWKDVVAAVRKHRKGNGLPEHADLNYELMVEYCQTTDSTACAEVDTQATERATYMTDLSRFLRAMDDALIQGNIVEQQEAERRAEICSRCPKNQPEKFNWCMGCAAKTVAASIAKRTLDVKTSYDAQLKTCHVCHCVLTLKVFCNRDLMDYPELKDQWWEECWMREGH